MPDEPDIFPVFGPRLANAKLSPPLGKVIRLRIDLEGCRGLPQTATSSDSSDSDVRPSYCVFSQANSLRKLNTTYSSYVEEGERSLRGTVQWNEVLDLECLESSLIEISVCSQSSIFCQYAMYLPIAQLLEKSEIVLSCYDYAQRDTVCALCLITSYTFSDANERGSDLHIGSSMRAQRNHIRVGPRVSQSALNTRATSLLHGILCQLPSLIDTIDTVNPSKIDAFHHNQHAYWIQRSTYTVYQHSLDSQIAHHPRIDVLMTSMLATMDAILRVATTYMLQREEYVRRILSQLAMSAGIMVHLSRDPQAFLVERKNPEAELARLTWIMVTPDPTIGASSISTSSNRRTVSGTIAKLDAVLLALEAIVQSSDVFPPLKSVASGLLFFTTSAEMASNNKKQVRDIYKRIDGLAASLKRGTAKGSPLTLEHQESISTLTEDIAALNEELN